MEPIRVLIVDDHLVVRQGIQMIVGTEPTVEIVGEADDGCRAIELAESLRPDVILMDLVLPHNDGTEAMTAIKQSGSKAKIVVLTTYEDAEKINAAIEAGADGFLLKDADGEALLRAIQAAHRGEMPLHPRIARYLLKGTAKSPASPPPERLTPREKEVLQLVAKGLSNKDIAGALNLCEGTVKIHVSNILGKLNVSSRTEAAVYAVHMESSPKKQRRIAQE